MTVQLAFNKNVTKFYIIDAQVIPTTLGTYIPIF